MPVRHVRGMRCNNDFAATKRATSTSRSRRRTNGAIANQSTTTNNSHTQALLVLVAERARGSPQAQALSLTYRRGVIEGLSSLLLLHPVFVDTTADGTRLQNLCVCASRAAHCPTNTTASVQQGPSAFLPLRGAKANDEGGRRSPARLGASY